MPTWNPKHARGRGLRFGKHTLLERLRRPEAHALRLRSPNVNARDLHGPKAIIPIAAHFRSAGMTSLAGGPRQLHNPPMKHVEEVMAAGKARAEERAHLASPLCAESHAEPFLQSTDRLFGRNEVHYIVRCVGCGFRYLSPRPADPYGSEVYPEDYPLYKKRLSKPSDKAAEHGLRGLKRRMDAHNLRRLGYRLDWLPASGPLARALSPLRRKRFRHGTLPPHGKCRLLEVGCATGRLLYRHKSLGWETTGVEMSDASAQGARDAGLDVRTGRVEEQVLRRGHFDVIVLMHVLEHLEDPAATLRDLAPLLAPGGQIMVEIPNADAAGLDWFGTYWMALDPPRHLSHFALRDIERLAERAGIHLTRHVTYNVGDWHARSLDYLLSERTSLPRFLRSGNFCRRIKLEKKFAPLFALFVGRARRDALRVWFEAGSGA